MLSAFEQYSRALLSFQLGDGGGSYETKPASPGVLDIILRQALRSGHCVLLGVGNGETARKLASVLPAGTGFTVCELYPEKARGVGDGLPLLVDTSPVALVWLLFSVGLFRESASCILNPEIDDPKTRSRFQMIQKLHASFSPIDPIKRASNASLSVSAILHPDEPELEDFFAALPTAASEAVVVWDSDSVPDAVPASPVPVRHLAHRLERNFAAQRNRMLSACTGDWVLYLDGDERLAPSLVDILPHLLGVNECNCFAFPRMAVTNTGIKIGWGLWPDLQIRLFKNNPGIRFVRPVHERLEGLSGPTGLVVGASIRHLSDVLKTPETLARKHALFDAAGGFQRLHRQNLVYPTLEDSFFSSLTEHPIIGTWPETVSFQPL
ncbi:MAG: glycosyl transferase family 2 [Desulfovibrio sp.]|nr:glycosyl transferase family 2 [Desulfovibrio sp.]MBI4959411.1 glycosyl transferase family 2 [Desulfovibrio sp.]